MKPPSRQPPNQILSAIGRHIDLTEAVQRSPWNAQYAGATARITEAARTHVGEELAHIDPALTYGCVDWYLYPDSGRQSHGDKAGRISP